MNRKQAFLLIAAAIILMMTAAILIGCSKKDSTDSRVQSFSMDDYAFELSHFAASDNVGPTADAENAAQKAESLWQTKYGSGVLEKKPYHVLYDPENQLWLIRGSLPPGTDGGVPYCIIEEKTGKVLAVWHDK